MSNKKGLVIGKFEVVHHGHEEMLREVSEHKGIDKVLAAITTNRRNIFSWEERKGMLEEITGKLSKPFVFYNVPDINNPPVYAEHVRKVIEMPSLDEVILFTGNPGTANCFKGKCEIEMIKINHPYSATRIIEMIGADDNNWEKQVPESTRKFIYEHEGVERIKRWFKMSPEKQRNPYPTTDIIIEYQGGIVLIERKNYPYGWAIPGGFHEVGLTAEDNAEKEAKEETGLDIDIKYLLGVYSDPKRDPRAHTISTVYVAWGSGKLNAGDDAKNARIFKEHQIPWGQIAFDHDRILSDYFGRSKE